MKVERDELYKDGVLTGKMKRLVEVVIAIRTGAFSSLVNQKKTR